MAKRDAQRRIDLPGTTINSAAISISGGGGGSGMAAHALFGPYHTGELDRTQATWVATDIATAIATHTAIEDAHHAKQHSITDPAHHTVSGAQYSVVGLSGVNTLGILPSASDVSAVANTLLRSDSLGGIAVAKLRSPAIDTASGGLTISPANSTTTITGTAVVTTGVQTPLITTASNVDLVIDAGGTGAVKFPNAQTVRASTFDSGIPLIKGWQINEVTSGSDYSALTIGKIKANELTVDIFVANETRVDRGDQLWTKSYGILYADFTTPGTVGQTVSVTFEDSPAITGAIFTNNDWILLRKLDINTGFSLFNVWGQVASYVNNSNGSQTWTFTLRSGPTNKLIPKGSLGIDFGASGAAFIHLSVLDAAGAPYIKMRKWVGSDPYTAANYTTYVQLGHLGSIGNSLYTPAGYGIYIRSTAAEGQFLVADDNGLQIRGADFKIYESSTPVVAITRNEGIMLGVGSSESAVEKKSVTWHANLASPAATPAFGIYGAILTGGDTYGMMTAYSATQFSSLYLKAMGPSATTSQIYMRSRTGSDSIIELTSDEVSMVAPLTRTGVLSVSGNLTVTGGNIAVSGTVDGVDVSDFKAAYDNHNHNSLYLALSGGTLTGTLTGRSIQPSATNTYDLGSGSAYYNHLYVTNLHTNTIVGTPAYSHTHDAGDITTGTLAEARLPHTWTGALNLDADANAGSSNYIRWTTQTGAKNWDLVARAFDYSTAAQQNDLLLTYFDGTTLYSVFQADSTTRVIDFAQTPTVGGTSVSLSTHNHDTAYVPLSRTVSAGAGLTGGGALSANITISHLDTSSQASVSNTTTNLIQSVTLDTYGHVTALVSADVATLLDDRYVNVTGDAMTGALTITSNTEGAGVGNQTYQLGVGKSGAGAVQIGTHNGYPALSGQGSGTFYRLLLNPENGGSVGIGTVSPAYRLDVNGTGRFAGAFYADANATVTGTLTASTSVVTPTITTASGNLSITSVGGTVAVTGALTGSSTATFTTSVRSPVVTTVSGDLTLAAANDILLDPVSNFVKLASGIVVQSDNYAPQTTGLRLTYDGQIDARYLFVDEMHAKSFIADLEQALAGGQIIAKSVAMLYSSFTAPAAGGTATLTLRDLPSATGMAVFVNGDYIRIRTFARSGGSLTIGDCWGTVTLDTTYGTSGFDSTTKTQRYTFTRSTSPNAGAMSTGTVVQPDAVILDYGTTGNGFYEVNAVDGAYGVNSPYAQVVTWTSHPRNQTIRARMGNLYGIWLQSGEYGLYAGDGTANTNQYLRISNTGVKLNNIPIQLYNGSTQTVNIDSAGQDIWVGPSSADKRLSWNGTTLSVTGQIVVQSGSSGYANITDKPTNLSGINSTEGSKLAGIAPGATVGATWGTNLNSIPGRFGDAPSAAGLYLTATHLGYYNGSAWKAWIAATGEFYFGGNSGAHLEWNGTKLRGIGADGTTEQWYAQSTDGKLYAGAGKIWLDATGVNLAVEAVSTNPTNVRFMNGTTIMGSIGYFYTAGPIPTANDGMIFYNGNSTKFRFIGATSSEFGATVNVTGSVTATVGMSVNGTAVSLVGHTHSEYSLTTHNHDTTYLALSGGTLTGTLTGRTVQPSATNTYDLGSSTAYYNHLYVTNLHTNTIVGTPSYSHSHDAADITSGTLAFARIPTTWSGALNLDADANAGSSNYVRWTTQTGSKNWDLVARAFDYATTPSQQNDLLLTYFDGTTLYSVFQADSATRVIDFAQTPTVGGTAVSLSNHNHDTAYVPLARTVTAGAGLTGGGALSADITISHLDTSTQATVTNTGTSFIQSVTLDTYGHVTALTSSDIGTALDSRYVNVTGDAMTGALTITSNTEGTGVGNQTYQLGVGKSGAGAVQIGTHNGYPALSGQGSGTFYRLLLNPENGGNVGIGTLSPAYRLDVNGTGRFAGAFYADANATVTGTLTASTSVVTPTITTASGNLSITSVGGTVAVTGALTGSSTATFSTNVSSPVLTHSSNLSITPSGDLTLDPTGNVVFPVAQTIKTPNFNGATFPIAGFQINENPSISGSSILTIGKVAVNELTADIFTANETRIDRGNQYWSKGFAVLYANFTTPSAIGSTGVIQFENSPLVSGALFSDNDWVLLQQVDINTGFVLQSVWGQVATYTPSGDRQSWTFTLRGGPTSTLLKKGRVAINFGASGQSLIHLNVVDSTGAPYIRFRKWVTDPISSSNYSTFTQIGNIGNLFGTTNEYGFYAGDGVGVNDKYLRLSNTPSFNNIPINMSAGGVTKVKLDANYGLDILLPGAELQPQAITWRSTLGSGNPITRLDSWATGDSTSLVIETTATTGNPAGTITIRAYNNAGTRQAGLTLISPPSTSSSAGIYGDTVAVGTLSSTVYINASSVIYFNADADLNNNDIFDVASIAIGSSSAGATLDVARGTLSGGTAVFRGATYNSHFNYSTTEDTYIRGGKSTSIVYINDATTSPIAMMSNRVQIRNDDSASAFWIRQDGTNTVLSSKTGDMYYGYAGITNLAHKFYAGGIATEVARIDSSGMQVTSGRLSVGMVVGLNKGISAGDTGIDYTPTSLTWNTTGTTLLLNANDYTTIGFHDSGNRVDFIRSGAGVITLGYDGGFGAARVDFGGTIGTTWSNLSMGSGWTSWDGGTTWYVGQYKKVGDMVLLQGLVRRTSGTGTTIATLPSGYRPAKSKMFWQASYDGTNHVSARIDVNNDGTVVLQAGSTSFVSLDGIVISTI